MDPVLTLCSSIPRHVASQGSSRRRLHIPSPSPSSPSHKILFLLVLLLSARTGIERRRRRGHMVTGRAWGHGQQHGEVTVGIDGRMDACMQKPGKGIMPCQPNCRRGRGPPPRQTFLTPPPTKCYNSILLWSSTTLNSRQVHVIHDTSIDHTKPIHRINVPSLLFPRISLVNSSIFADSIINTCAAALVQGPIRTAGLKKQGTGKKTHDSESNTGILTVIQV